MAERAATVLGGVLIAAICRSHGAQHVEPSPDLRARAWATIARIHDDSIHSVEFHETVRVHFEDGSDVVQYEYDVRADDLRCMRVVGRWCHMNWAMDAESYRCQAVEYAQVDGVVLAQNRATDRPGERPTVIVRFERPDRMDPWSVPGVLKGLGHAPVVHNIRTRAEQLLECPDLAIMEEDSRRIVLHGKDQYYNNHPYRVRVELDASTGAIVRYQLIDSVWDRLVTDWITTEWEAVADVRIPTRLEYRMYERAVTAEQHERLQLAREHANLPKEAMMPDHPRFREWVEVRTRVLGDGTPIRLAAPWQSSEARIVAVNVLHDSSWFGLDILPDVRFLSAPLECVVDGPSPIPGGLGALPAQEPSGG